ncbi:hypothetical protein [Parasphingopyxis algicola]|uniref:hypothetical protein n=1 Tax=Parasphingopyxis algicola TaxID=2026624 RepID=UPI001FEA8193|nr:hypothetical protein [Parasphingopyxis algicola]
MSGKTWLTIGGSLSAIAALLHLAVIVGGPAWYRFFGAGEQMAGMAEQGLAYPALITFAIAAISAIWAAYAFSGAGLLPRLPLLRTALVMITAIYLLRGLAFIPAMAASGTPITPFAVWSSLIVLVYGIAYALGTWQRWPLLAGPDGEPAP